MQEKEKRVDINDSGEGLVVSTRSFVRKILFSDLVYVDVFNHHVFFHIIDGDEVSVRGPLYSWALKILICPVFVFCHSSIIVNMRYVSIFSKDFVELKSGEKLPVARRYAVAFRETYEAFLKKDAAVSRSAEAISRKHNDYKE